MKKWSSIVPITEKEGYGYALWECFAKLFHPAKSGLNIVERMMAKGTKLSLDLGASWNEGWELETEHRVVEKALLEPSAHKLVFQREKRKGKVVTLIGPFSVSDGDAQKFLSILKKSLACGGTYKEGWMEFQGDIAPKLRDACEKLGFRFKNPK